MAINFIQRRTNTFQGLSTDVKPTTSVFSGDQFWELDSGLLYVFSSGAWFQWTSDTADNRDSTVLTLTAQGSGIVNSTDQTNYQNRGVIIGINITAISGTGATLTVTVQGKDVASGQYYTLLAGTGLTTTGFSTLTVYPGTTAATNSISNSPLSHIWRINAAVAGTTPSVTATIGASLIV